MHNEYDVILVGAGPANIFAALQLSEKAKVLIIEKGRDIEQRVCPVKGEEKQCLCCEPCSMVCGWGGAGAFSDGKLTLAPEIGGKLGSYLGRQKLAELIDQVDKVFLSFGASQTLYGQDDEEVRDLERRAASAGLSLIPACIRHLGTENCYRILRLMRRKLGDKVEIMTKTAVKKLLCENGAVSGIETEDGRCLTARYVVCAPGREGANWIYQEAARLGLKGSISPVDIGVRVEVPAVVTEHLTERVYEPKLVYYSQSFDDRVRTFCMSPYGEVVTENNSGLITVNGHSYTDRKTKNTNFALLVSKNFTEPFTEPIRYGENIASLANMLGGGVLVQRLGDLLAGRRSTRDRIQRGLVNPTLKQATPGDLSLVLPYRHMLAIMEMLESLDKIAPGIYSRHTLLYGVEVKFYSFRLMLTAHLETKVSNLFAAGDGAGITRGLVQASASGIVAANEINRRLGL